MPVLAPHCVQNLAPDLSAAPQLVQNFALVGGVCAGAAVGAGAGVGDAGAAGLGAGAAVAVAAATLTPSKVTAVVVPELIHMVSSNARPPYAARMRYLPAGNSTDSPNLPAGASRKPEKSNALPLTIRPGSHWIGSHSVVAL